MTFAFCSAADKAVTELLPCRPAAPKDVLRAGLVPVGCATRIHRDAFLNKINQSFDLLLNYTVSIIVSVEGHRASVSADGICNQSKIIGGPAIKIDEDASTLHLIPTIFHNPWWLELVTNGRAEMVEYCENGRVVGRLPFVRETRFGICSSNMPAFTHFLGPAIDAGDGTPQNRARKKHSITSELIGKLPRLASFRQKFYREITDVIEFQAAQFVTMVQFTFEIAPAETDMLWQAMRKRTRNAVRNGRKHYQIGYEYEPEEFISFYRANIKKRGMTENVDLTLGLKMLRGCLARGCGRFFAARNDGGVVEAAIFVIWDQTSCYLLMATRAPDSRYGAMAGLVWEAIQFAATLGLIFDFDGIAGLGAARFFAGFGGAVSPRYIVSRANLTYRMLQETRRFLTDAYNPFC
jgi:hypothetical protein